MRQILRQREIVADDWVYLSDAPPDASDAESIIVALADWRANPQRWTVWRGRLGLKLAPADRIEDCVDLLPRLKLIACEFPGPSEGRGYTQARMLRERYGYTDELRAVGAVKQDQIFLLARCGFDAFEVACGEDLQAAKAALHSFTVAYQPSSDLTGAAPKMRPLA
jgi:uncharacterized protein (DUF934 family)